MDSLLELDERNVWVRVNYGKRGPGLRMCFSAWYREKAEAIIMIGTTKTFTYTCAFKWNVVLPSCIDMSIFYLFRYVSNRAHGPLTSWELGRVSVDMILFEVCLLQFLLNFFPSDLSEREFVFYEQFYLSLFDNLF